MAPSLISRRAAALLLRQFIGNTIVCNNGDFECCNSFGCGCCHNSNWGSWGRWVLLAAVIVFFLVVFVGLACVNSRRRRRQGLSPRYGTGWAAGKTPIGHSAPQYNNGGAAPPYTAAPVYGQNTGNTFNSNDGYYGQQTGIELQQPEHVYSQPGQYAPPEGAPPRTKN